jgi:ribosomal protein L35
VCQAAGVIVKKISKTNSAASSRFQVMGATKVKNN